MKFLCLAYYEEELFEKLSATELDAILSQCPSKDEALQKSGRLVAIGSLAEPATTRSIRPRRGKPLITDGPFVETKEQIGAFFIIDADGLDEAARLASIHPAATLGEEIGWGIEIRPIEQENVLV